MKKVLLSMALMAATSVVAVGTASARVSNNTSSNVVTVNSCAEMGRILNNISSNVVMLSSLGQCNVSDIVNNIATGNTSSNIIRIGNACGATTSTANVSNNTSSNIIQIGNTGPCKTDQPTTVTVTPATTTTTPAPTAAQPAKTAQAVPTKLPVTGAGSVAGLAAGMGLLAYAGSYIRFLTKP